jgi:hypothetical protein
VYNLQPFVGGANRSEGTKCTGCWDLYLHVESIEAVGRRGCCDTELLKRRQVL